MNNKTLTEKIFHQMEKDILNLEYKPGQAITEQELSDRFGISRTPSRDIIQKLKSKGLIVTIPFKSSYVALLDIDVIKQGIFMRLELEKAVLNRAIQTQYEKLIAEIEYNLKLQGILLKTEFKAEEFYELDCKFHKIWFEATKNMFVWEQIHNAQIHYERFRMLDIKEAKDFDSIFKDHMELFEDIKNKDITKINETMDKHLNSGLRRLNMHIDNNFSGYFKQV